MLGSFLGRAIASAARSVAAVAVNAVVAEMKKPETQAKVAQTIVTAHRSLNDPEKRAALEQAAGTAGKSAMRALGRAAGTLRNKISGD